MNEILALIGKGTYSYGCGVLVTFDQVKYLATAGHVIRAMGGCPAWAIHGPTLKCTQNPAGGYALVDEVIDTQGKSDLVICQLTRDIYSSTINLNDLHPAGNLIGRKVIAVGYPVEYILEQLKRESEDPLPPLQARGIITGRYDEKIRAGQDEIPFTGGYFVQMEVPLKNSGSGFSGALVMDEHSLPLGIIVGGSQSGDLIFSPIARLMPLLGKR